MFEKKNGGSTALGDLFPNKLEGLFFHVVILVLLGFPIAYQVAYNNLALSLNRGEKVSRMPQ